MIRLSAKSRYAARFMLELALNETKGPILLKDIAKNQDISAGYLEQIVPLLKSSNLIISSRGPRGGYALAKNPSGITIKNIIEAVEGPVKLVECIGSPTVCAKSDICAAEALWSEISSAINILLESKNLSHLVQKHRENKKTGALNYII